MPRVLVVDDDPSIARLLRDLLARWPIEVVATTEVHRAVDLLLSGAFGAVILDLTLSEGTGFDVLDAMRHANIMTRAIVISSRLPDYANYLLNPVQVLTIMRKPFDNELMAAAILGLCGTLPADARSVSGSARPRESRTDL